MTDAIASRNVTKSNATIEIEQNLNITQNDNQIFVPKLNISCNCNETIASNQNANIQCTNTTAADNDGDCSKTILNNDDEVKNLKTENESDNKDTILKYVYKKNETNNPEKTKGHYKNSLRRKRRSPTDNKPLQNSQPVIVNYETLHTPFKDREQWLPAKQTAYVIKGSDLADFNIETLHATEDDKKIQNSDRARTENDDREQEQSGEISDRDLNENKRDIKNSSEENESRSQERDESNERNSDINENSREDIKQNVDSNESNQSDDRSTESRGREIDSDDDHRSNNLKFKKSQNEGSSENSEEVDENTNSRRNHNNSPQKIQNVDLDDFSYERIQLNKNGEVEPAVDAPGNKDVELIPIIKSQPIAKTHDETNAKPYESLDSFSKEANEPTHIDDGEVKPVVEINPETESVESNEENSSLSNENESLETLTGVKEDSNEKYDKLQEEKGGKDVDDVKQDFERVPLNYNHENQKETKTKGSKENNHSDNRDDDGTVDRLAPKSERFDDNLNIKFDDIAIKLPEIKLPEDILSYPYEDPPVYKSKEVKKKPDFFYYNSEEGEVEKKKRSDHDDDDDDDDDSGRHNTDDSEHHNDGNSNDYYGYTKKQQAYKKHKNENKEKDLYLEDDPYEKFVQERFGKRNTFKKRSEKLRDLGGHNPELYNKVQKIIEKTRNINKEAAQSGDPNAGYMWALEYGEKL